MVVVVVAGGGRWWSVVVGGGRCLLIHDHHTVPNLHFVSEKLVLAWNFLAVDNFDFMKKIVKKSSRCPKLDGYEKANFGARVEQKW